MSSTNSTYCNKGTTKCFASKAPFLASLIACIPRNHMTTDSRRLLSVSTLVFLSSFSLTNLSQNTHASWILRHTVLFISSNSLSLTIVVMCRILSIGQRSNTSRVYPTRNCKLLRVIHAYYSLILALSIKWCVQNNCNRKSTTKKLGNILFSVLVYFQVYHVFFFYLDPLLF